VLPFVFIDESKLGPFHVYGVACMLGFFAWDWAVMRQATRRGLDRHDFRALTIWVLATGAFFAWWIDAVFYHPPGRSVVSTLFAFQGFSSVGGIVGATVGGLAWRALWIGKKDGKLRIVRREAPMAMLPVADVIVSTWPIGWAFGRLGCALIHDHVGVRVAPGTIGSLFAVGFPRGPDDGVHHALGPIHVITGGSEVRFDLGLLEFLVLAAIAIGFALTWKRDLRLGTRTIAGCLAYGPVRFGLDFLREHDGPTADLRHAGLTFAQYFSVAIVVLAFVLLARRGRDIVPALADEARTALR
jgi:phosphatidylglycerol---prolipoprotein diacylglyceryl transferase